MATATRSWTPAQARYERETQVVVGDLGHAEAGAIVRHYVMTVHGAVARTWLMGNTRLRDSSVVGTYVNVALWRPKNLHPQWQGDVMRVGDEWVARLPNEGPEVGCCTEYLRAEAMLLRQRTRTRSHGSGRWPDSIRQELYWRRERGATCTTCGTRLTAWGACPRPELHWN